MKSGAGRPFCASSSKARHPRGRDQRGRNSLLGGRGFFEKRDILWFCKSQKIKILEACSLEENHSTALAITIARLRLRVPLIR
jgi:hypothetical protein